MSSSVNSLFYLKVLRALAAIAVVAIHVVAPYRQQYGLSGNDEWFVATSINAFSRWAVPVFILITGGLFLSDQKPFDPRYFFKRRISKVVVPFLVWSVFYAGLAGLNKDFSFVLDEVIIRLKALPDQATWYHLGFYYYFIPLYFIIPLLRPVIQKLSTDQIKLVLLLWIWLTFSYGLNFDSILHIDLILYGGYLVLGYYLMNQDLRSKQKWFVIAGIAGLLVTQLGVWWMTSVKGSYTVGRFLSYRTLNVVLVASMVFVLAKHYSNGLPERIKSVASELSKYSLGIYLLHPIFLWPVHQFDLYFAHAAIVIPFWITVVVILSYGLSRLLSSTKATAWLVP